MKEKIASICKQIEKEKGIKILFAVENGSRAWRMESEDSDYDVRFVFVRPLREYLKINPSREVIETAFDEVGNKCAVEGALIDMTGFDVFKFAKMLQSSNPTTIEWLMSDIVYYGEQNSVFKEFAIKHFHPISLYYHYKSMCKNNYLKYLKSGTLVTYKKYLYAYRGLINAKWVVHKKSVPPIIFIEALEGMKGIIPEYVLARLNKIIELKSHGQEKDAINNIKEMDEYIESFLKNDGEAPKEKSYATLDALNCELQRLVLEESIKTE